jgi:phosphoglycolate phosphatase-like HAD superfamily hydrolase
VIVSSSIDDVTTHLERSGVLHLFELIDVGIPHKQEKLREIASRFGTKKNEAFYLDDTADGVQCAKEAGIAAFGFTQGFNLEERIREAKPHHVVHSFHDALSIIKD